MKTVLFLIIFLFVVKIYKNYFKNDKKDWKIIFKNI